MLFEFEDVKKHLSLDAATLKLITKTFGIGEEIDHGQALLLWTADLLWSLPLLSAEQRNLLLQEIQPQVKAAADESAYPKDGSLYCLIVADAQLVTISGWTRWMDLKTMELVEGPTRPMETLTYYLNEIYRRRIMQLDANSTDTSSKRDAQASVDG